jgi:hypothetical protein
MENNGLFHRGILLILCVLLGFVRPSLSLASPESDEVWKNLGFDCLNRDPATEIPGSPIAILNGEFYQWGVSYYAKDKNHAYILLITPIHMDWHLFREPLESIGNAKLPNNLERFQLTKATASCDRIDLTYFSVPLDRWLLDMGRSGGSKKALQISALLQRGRGEDGKGEFGDPDFFSYGLRASITEINQEGKIDLGDVVFERIAKIRKRSVLNLPNTNVLDLKLIAPLTQDICGHLKQVDWITNLPVTECVKMLRGEPSIFDSPLNARKAHPVGRQ